MDGTHRRCLVRMVSAGWDGSAAGEAVLLLSQKEEGMFSLSWLEPPTVGGR